MIREFRQLAPRLAPAVFVAPTAVILGDVKVGDSSSIWYGSILRGDVGSIQVGERTNVQDLCVLHVTSGRWNTAVGSNVTIGHRCVIHGCEIEDEVLVGMGSVLLDGAVIGAGSIIGAGSLVTPGTHVPGGSLVLGSPARVARPVRDEEREWIRRSAAHYIDLAREHQALSVQYSPGASMGEDE